MKKRIFSKYLKNRTSVFKDNVTKKPILKWQYTHKHAEYQGHELGHQYMVISEVV